MIKKWTSILHTLFYFNSFSLIDETVNSIQHTYIPCVCVYIYICIYRIHTHLFSVGVAPWMCGCLYLNILFFKAGIYVIYLQLFLLVLSDQSLLMDVQLLDFLSDMPRKPQCPVLSPAHLRVCVSLSLSKSKSTKGQICFRNLNRTSVN